MKETMAYKPCDNLAVAWTGSVLTFTDRNSNQVIAEIDPAALASHLPAAVPGASADSPWGVNANPPVAEEA